MGEVIESFKGPMGNTVYPFFVVMKYLLSIIELWLSVSVEIVFQAINEFYNSY